MGLCVFGRLVSLLKRIWSHKVIQISVYVIGSYILFNAIGGIIGNSTYVGAPPQWMKDIWNDTSNFFVRNLLIILSFTSAVGLVFACIFGNRLLITSRALSATSSLTELDDSLLRLITNLLLNHKAKSQEELDKELRRILQELLKNAVRTVLGSSRNGRALILVPDLPPPSEEYLIIIASYRLSPMSVNRTKFYVGSDESKQAERGTAGMAYLNKKICIAHIVQNNGYHDCDNDDYINFDEARAKIPYQTFVNIPIIGLPITGQTDILGILCLDSLVPNAFDSKRAKTMLETITRRVAAVLTIHLQLMQEQNCSVPYFKKASSGA